MIVLSRRLDLVKINQRLPRKTDSDIPRDSHFRRLFDMNNSGQSKHNIYGEIFTRKGIHVLMANRGVETTFKGEFYTLSRHKKLLNAYINNFTFNFPELTSLTRVDICMDVLANSSSLSEVFNFKDGMTFKPKRGKCRASKFYSIGKSGEPQLSSLYVGSAVRFLNIYNKGVEVEENKNRSDGKYQYYKHIYGKETDLNKVFRVELRVMNRSYLKKHLQTVFDLNFGDLYTDLFSDFFNFYEVKTAKGNSHRQWQKLKKMVLAGTI